MSDRSCVDCRWLHFGSAQLGKKDRKRRCRQMTTWLLYNGKHAVVRSVDCPPITPKHRMSSEAPHESQGSSPEAPRPEATPLASSLGLRTP